MKERLEFEGSDQGYHSYEGTQHVVRYSIVRSMVHGKRVLDVACGEGYGVKLLADWGATEVVGIDVSPSAIATAKRLFGRKGCTFLTGDAEQLPDVLAGVEPFDVIVSFETVEHLARPQQLLAAIPALLKADGIVAVSCPNERIYHNGVGQNPFHLNTFSFDEFRGLCETHLGPASQWMLGAPVQGEMNFIAGDAHVEIGHSTTMAIASPGALDGSLLLPAQKDLEVSAGNCSHYVGLWGAKVGPHATVSAMSVPRFREPWLMIDQLKAYVGELEKKKTEYWDPEIARLGSEIEAQEKTKCEWYEPELARLGKDAELASDRIRQSEEALASARRDIEEHFKPELDRLKSVIAQYETTKREWYEPELARLAKDTELASDRIRQSEEALASARNDIAAYFELEVASLRTSLVRCESERSPLLREIQDQRARVLYYVEQVTLLTTQIDPLRDRVNELEKLKRDWFDPEFSRMQAQIEQYESTKKKWFEPQMEQRQAKINALEAQLKSLTRFQKSRSYRIWRQFQKLYDVPVIGSGLRGVNRVMRIIWPLRG